MSDAVIIMLIGLTAVSSYCFFKFLPDIDNKPALKAFNISIVIVAFLFAGAWAFRLKGNLVGTDFESLYGVIAFGGIMLIYNFVIGVAFVMRNYWIFRPTRRPGDFL
jgi:hypothetical protein